MPHVNGHHHKTPTHPLKKAEKPEESFKARDINKDGVLSGTETKGLKGYDGDSNKEISQDEYKAGRGKEAHEASEARLKKAYDKFDINHDGKLSGTETKEHKDWDKDGDGEISKDEFKAGRHEEWQAKLDAKFDEVFNNLEVNSDNELTGTEAAKHKAWDADGDGKITKDEAKAGWTEDRKQAKENQVLNGGKLDDMYRLDVHDKDKPKTEHKHKEEHKTENHNHGRVRAE
jgi:Ca2+-binding EF-hand superfamily protein